MHIRKPILIAILLLAGVIPACTVPAWVNTVEADARVAVPIAASLVTVIDPALAPAAAAVQKGFAALVAALETYKATPTATNLQAVDAAFTAVDSNVAQLEAAAQIKNPGAQQTVTSVVNLLAQAVTEIAALVPASAPAKLKVPGTAPWRVEGQAKGWKARDFKKAFNRIAEHDARLRKM